MKPARSVFDALDDALDAMGNCDDIETRRMLHSATLRLIESVLRNANERLARLRKVTRKAA